MNKTLTLSILLAVLILSACSSSQAQSVTMVAPPPAATKTQVPTAAPTETPTFTPTATPDSRVINTQPRLIILTVDELAEIGEYGVNASLEAYQDYGASYYNPYANLDCTLGYDGAVEFLETTGLVTGWTTYFNLQPRFTTLPEYVVMTALVFDSIAGPERLFESWGQPCEFGFYDYIGDIVIGEKATLCRYEMWMANGELSHIRYRLAIQYRNVYLGMLVSTQTEENLDLNKFYEIAFLQLEKLENLPLEDEVTLAQDFTTGAGCITPPTPMPRRSGEESGTGNAILGVCVPKTVNGVKVCVSQCLLECPERAPWGERLKPDDCMPCVYTGAITKDPQN